MPDQSSLPSLTAGLKGLQTAGEADLKLTADVRDQYLNLISTYRASLQGARGAMTALEGLENPGTLTSANQTATNLRLDVTGTDGVEQTIDKYLDYLDELEKTVKAAADRMLQAG